MNIVLKRVIRKDKYTIGNIFIDGQYICDTLEDKDRGLWEGMTLDEIKSKKVYGETCIPYGTYNINMNTVSPKFQNRSWAKPYDGKLPRLENVKGFEGVLIHVGNSHSDTLGCILVGTYYEDGGLVINSTSAFKKLMSILLKNKDEQIILKIE